MNFGTSHIKTVLTVAAQAVGLAPAIRTIATVVAPKGTSNEISAASASQMPSASMITLDVTRQDYRLNEGWWGYVATASIASGTPPRGCHLTLRVDPPLQFDDPRMDTPIGSAITLTLPPQPTPTVTVPLETVDRVLPKARPRKATIHSVAHCPGFVLQRSDVSLVIPPRPEKLVPDPSAMNTYVRTGKFEIRFHVVDNGDVEVIPAMTGQDSDGVWDILFDAPQPVVTVDRSDVPLRHTDSIATAVIHWNGPGAAMVSGSLTTTSSTRIHGAASINVMFPWWPFIIAVVGVSGTQMLRAVSVVESLRWWLRTVSGLAWGLLAFFVWYLFGPVASEVTFFKVIKVGGLAGAVPGSYWIAAVAIICTPPLLKLGSVIYPALAPSVRWLRDLHRTKNAD